MCRLFAMSGGPERLAATFWLLEAPDSIVRQSYREPDGTGLGSYRADGRPRVSKQPLAAHADREFVREARKVRSHTFIAHIRFASTGAAKAENTHPFELDRRLFAHNGVVGDLARMEEQLGPAGRALVHGDTDSERVFALIDCCARTLGGDIGEAITTTARWIARSLPLFALNVILIDESELWALRYPDTHELYVLERAPGGHTGGRHLDHAGAHLRVHAEQASGCAVVVLASEPLDDDPGWRLLESGELLHVDADLNVSGTRVLDEPPAFPLKLADLDPHAAASQSKSTTPR
jgi:predicted glutamine amidotransferase